MNPIVELSKIKKLTEFEQMQIKKGAYVIVKDKGNIYNTFFHQGTIRAWCEHASENSVYDVPGTVGNVLIGMNKDTWIQWERSEYCSCNHLYDWLRFICSHKNQGPYGETSRTEHRPLIIEPAAKNYKLTL